MYYFLKVSATLDNDTIYIYEKKIMEWSLMEDESFRWCCHVSMAENKVPYTCIVHIILYHIMLMMDLTTKD